MDVRVLVTRMVLRKCSVTLKHLQSAAVEDITIIVAFRFAGAARIRCRSGVCTNTQKIIRCYGSFKQMHKQWKSHRAGIKGTAGPRQDSGTDTETRRREAEA